jgi:hypothetical protein
MFYACLYIIVCDYLKDVLFALTNSQVIFIAVFLGVLNFDVCNMTGCSVSFALPPFFKIPSMLTENEI